MAVPITDYEVIPRRYTVNLPYDHPTARRLWKIGVGVGEFYIPDLNPDMVLWMQEAWIDAKKDSVVEATFRFQPAAPFATWDGRLEIVRSIK